MGEKSNRSSRVSRRTFIKATSTFTAASTVASQATPVAAEPEESAPPSPPRFEASAGPERAAQLKIEGNRLWVETWTQTALFEEGRLVSLKSRSSGRENLHSHDWGTASPLALIFGDREAVDIGRGKFGEISLRRINPLTAEYRFHTWDGDGLVKIAADPETGDVLVEPSAFSSRPGARACRWEIRGIPEETQLVAPFFQGTQLPLSDPLVKDSHWPWPMMWEAGLAIFQGERGGFWVHCRDTAYRYKSLSVGNANDSQRIGFESEAYGPISDSLSAGGLTWRINVFEGGWQVPALSYRDWLWRAYQLTRPGQPTCDWLNDIKMAISWCPGEIEILDQLARRISPSSVLIHFPDWRTDPYDENYPKYQASPSAKTFIERAKEMGFRVMPHCNSVDMDPSHPAYELVRDFQYRDIESKRILGWSWYEGRPIGVPESNRSRQLHRDKKVMVKVHPGHSMWRSIVTEQIGAAATELSLSSVFIDVTLTTWNLHNSLVEGLTSSEGMLKLICETARLQSGLVVGGEGLNEITFQGLSFAQAHLFRSWQENASGLERTGGCNLNSILFGARCRTFGYSGLGGRTEEERLRHRIHLEHDAIPTITIRSAEEVTKPNATVEAVLDSAS